MQHTIKGGLHQNKHFCGGCHPSLNVMLRYKFKPDCRKIYQKILNLMIGPFLGVIHKPLYHSKNLTGLQMLENWNKVLTNWDIVLTKTFWQNEQLFINTNLLSYKYLIFSINKGWEGKNLIWWNLVFATHCFVTPKFSWVCPSSSNKIFLEVLGE